jgi:N6-L-threonylcarbamoyladenine synthase
VRVLGIESTCDETAAAVVEEGRVVRSNVIATQFHLHEVYRGVVPEIASRAHVEAILPVIDRALRDARTTLDSIDRIAVAHRPGLIGSLLVGVSAAKTLAWSLGRPLVGVDHVQAHLYSVMLDRSTDVRFPAVGLVCSGGHTAIYHIESWTDVVLLGRTIDDAVGEAYDKVASMLGLGYPGGPILDQLAQTGDPRAIDFPRSTLGRESLDFSFSGLKTSVLYHVHGHGRRVGAGIPTGQALHDLAASFQAACIDVLLRKLGLAARRIGAKSVVVGGGVSANRGLRAALTHLGVEVHLPDLAYCTDNAAMIAGLGAILPIARAGDSLELDALTASSIERRR